MKKILIVVLALMFSVPAYAEFSAINGIVNGEEFVPRSTDEERIDALVNEIMQPDDPVVENVETENPEAEVAPPAAGNGSDVEPNRQSEGGTLIPYAGEVDCKAVMNDVNGNVRLFKQAFNDRDNDIVNEVLGCAITTGQISLWMIPYYIRYILNLIIGLSGLVAMGAIIVGGYLYVFAGLSDDKDSGKKAIKNGFLGLIVVMLAWGVVNIVISVLTL